MIPRLDISAPEIFLRAFYNPRTYGPKEKLEEDIKNFQDFFALNGEAILKEIEKLSGFAWSKERIPVYLVPDGPFCPPYSFAKSVLEDGLPGVVQKIGRPGGRDIQIHIHELAHINQWQSEWARKGTGYVMKENGEKNVDLSELGADLVAINVIRNIFGIGSEYEKDFWDFLKNTNEKNKRKYEILVTYQDEWDLSKNTLRHYLEQTPRLDLDNLL